MATKNVLPVNYQDDIIGADMGGKRRYNLINNPDGTVSLEDVTEYTQVGSDFGAKNINETNIAVNACYSSSEVDSKLGAKVDASNVINNASTLLTATNTNQVAGAVGIKGLKDYIPTNQIATYSGNLDSLGTGIFKCALGSCSNYPSNIPKSTVTVLSYKNALQIIVPSDSNDYTAYRRYDGGWQKWVVEGASCNFNDAYKGGLIADALGVDLTNPYGNANKTGRVDRKYGSYNLPKNCQFGVREVTWVDTSWVIVRITGVSTQDRPMAWVAEYSCGAWKGWSMITQGLDRGTVSRMHAGSWVLKPATGVTSVQLMTNTDIEGLLGTTGVSNENTLVLAINGDGNADSKHYEGCTYKGGGWYVVFNGTNYAKQIRINWIIIHWGDAWNGAYGGA